jgi:hypothetical protein
MPTDRLGGTLPTKSYPAYGPLTRRSMLIRTRLAWPQLVTRGWWLRSQMVAATARTIQAAA